MKKIDDPALYRKLCEPIPAKELQATIDGFFDEVRALREKYKIRDCLTIIEVDVAGKTEKEMVTYSHDGASIRALWMLAQVYGDMKRAVNSSLNNLAAEEPEMRAYVADKVQE